MSSSPRPEVFQLPGMADLRYNWVVARLDALDPDEMSELVTDAWRMCVPKKVAAAYDLESVSERRRGRES